MNPDKKREQILQRIRAVTKRQDEYSEQAFAQLTARNGDTAEALRSFPDTTAEFSTQAVASGCQVVELGTAEEVPSWLQGITSTGKPILLSPQRAVRSLDWSSFTVLEEGSQSGRIGVAKASMAAAETGSLMLHSQAVSSALLFLVETLVVILDRSDIKPRYEDLWAGFSPLATSGEIPRAVHLISGPSRTADVEQTIQIGAHGPREIYVVILTGTAPAPA